ncbi:MAG: 30S ribosomal protein S4 [Candidatus Ratteibacteria bacterium]|nr:30S ribosomal protein S4 [Candidatus Ratteibacteria bacterium]
MRYTGSKCKLCKRANEKLFLKGSKCRTAKCIITRKTDKSDKKGKTSLTASRKRRTKLSDYGVRLAEKQKLRNIYGLSENSFHNLFNIAAKKKGDTGEVFLTLLERRLDNVIFKMGFANSRAHARQLVGHKFFIVGKRKVNIPSYLVKENEVIKLDSNKQEKLKNIISTEAEIEVPLWLSVDRKKLEGKVLRIPKREEISVPVEENLIVEFYSR